MRTSDDARERARDLYALARSSPHADDALVYVLRAMELEAEPHRKRGRKEASNVDSDRMRRSRG